MTKKLAIVLGAAAFLAAATSAEAHDLSGLWNTTVTLVDCTSGQQLAPPFTSLLSFSKEGTESEVTNNPVFQPGQRSTGYGVWSHAGVNTFHMNSYALILFSTQGPPPIQAGSQEISQDIALAGKTWTSTATVQFFDTTGALVGSGCATAASVRMK